MSEISIKSEKKCEQERAYNHDKPSSEMRLRQAATKKHSTYASPRNASIVRGMPAPTASPSPSVSQQQHRNRAGRSSLPPSFPGARCGEIFVANNARLWTFICTYCNKSTRDIGDFICHIKTKHLEDTGCDIYYDDGAGDSDDAYQDQDVSNHHVDTSSAFDGISNSRIRSRKAIQKITPISQKHAAATALLCSSSYVQRPPTTKSNEPTSKTHSQFSSEYFDCGSYLDVNVHTEPDELQDNGQQVNDYEQKSTATRQQHQPVLASVERRSKKIQPMPSRQNVAAGKDFVVDLLDDDDDDDDLTDGVNANGGHRNGRHNASVTKVNANSTTNMAAARETSVNGNEEYESFDYSDEQYPHANLEMEVRRYEDDEDDIEDDDDDFDNQLLLAPNDSLDAMSPGIEVKAKRRQIRGTAYCTICNKTFQYYSLYRNHMIKHSNETPFKCPLCKKGFKSKQAIRYHMKTHQREKQFKCQLCQASYYTESQFITHVMTHEDARTFPCMVCGEILGSEKGRDEHLASHTEERPFRCDFCNKLFRLRHHLSNHLKLHRQYRCDYCKEEFTSAVHQRKPYACTDCEQRPDVKSHLDANRVASSMGGVKKHMASVNPLQLFEAVMPPQQPTECGDYAEMVTDSEDDNEIEEDEMGDEEPPGEEEEDNYEQESAGGTEPRQRLACKYCPRTYSHTSGLNYHIRTKH